MRLWRRILLFAIATMVSDKLPVEDGRGALTRPMTVFAPIAVALFCGSRRILQAAPRSQSGHPASDRMAIGIEYVTVVRAQLRFFINED